MPITVSIIIPTKDQYALLLETLDKALSAMAQDTAELIVVNNGTPFGLPPAYTGRVQLIQHPAGGVAMARNAGARQAQGEVLLFLDDDMWLNAAALKEVHALHQQQLLAAQVYTLNWQYPASLLSRYRREKTGRYILRAGYHSLAGRAALKAPLSDYMPATGIGSGSLVIGKHLFETHGGYNERIGFQGEDIEFSNRLRQAGIRLMYDLRVCLEHNQVHRLHINDYLGRLDRGYRSELSARKEGLLPLSAESAAKWRLYRWLRPFEKPLIAFYKLIPNHPFFDRLSFGLIDRLSALQRFKHL